MTNDAVVPSEVRLQYVAIIDDILASADLTQITEKRIRNGIQDRVEYDITPQKAAIKTLILERFDVHEAKSRGEEESVPVVASAASVASANGHVSTKSKSPSTSAPKRAADDSDLSDVQDVAPASKKRKEGVKHEEIGDDAAFAAMLQAEEDRAARPTRGGAPRKQKAAQSKKSKTPKKKTAAKVTGSDDSDIEVSGTARKVNRETGFHKPMNLSETATDFFGTPQLSRPQVTKKIWEHIKGNNLQDPTDKRFILCDDKMKALLKQDKVHMFTMTKLLSQHLYNPEE